MADVERSNSDVSNLEHLPLLVMVELGQFTNPFHAGVVLFLQHGQFLKLQFHQACCQRAYILRNVIRHQIEQFNVVSVVVCVQNSTRSP